MTFTPWQSRASAWGSGLLLAAAFPPINWWPLALVALVPVFLAVWSRPDDSATEPKRHRIFWRGFRLGWQFGFVFFTATLWWVYHVTLPGMLALTAYLALYPALALGIAAWLRGRDKGGQGIWAGKLVLTAAAWAGLEWVRATALSGFPWNGLGVPLFPMASARWLSAWVGAIGLSWFVMITSLAIAAVLHETRGRRAAAGLFRVLSLAVILELAFRMAGPGKNGTDLSFHQAALVQPNITFAEKLSPDPEVQRQRYFDLEDMTAAALAQNPQVPFELVVWPESAVPGYFHDLVQGGGFAEPLSQGNFTLVTGADHEDYGKLYNSVVAMRGSVQNYALHAKVCLVPFGEFIPFRRQIPLLQTMLGGLIPMDFSRGTSLEPIMLEGQPFSIVPLVCFEDTIGDHARRFIRPVPQVMVNVTNDNWFHQSPATEIHLANARWRTTELERTLVRSANTGATVIISPEGGIQRIPNFQPGVLTGYFHTGNSRITFYARHGDVFSKTAGVMALLGIIVIGWRRNQAKGEHDSGIGEPPQTAEDSSVAS